MDYRYHEKGYVETLAQGGTLTKEQDALDLVAGCWENQTRRLLIHAETLPPEFFQLKTGLAGQVLQKFVNYEIVAAMVVPESVLQEGRFAEMALEANRARQFHFAASEAEAVAWLMEPG